MRTRTVVAIAALAATGSSVDALAAPVTFTGTAKIVGCEHANPAADQLPDFLAATPALDDILTFNIIYDAATVGAGGPAAPDSNFNPGGITAFTMTLNGVTLTADPAASQRHRHNVADTTGSWHPTLL